MTITEVKGDLFTSKNSLAHCVSEDLKMGKGIAKTFKDKFGSVNELRLQKKKVGEVAYIKNDNRYIFYLITKEKYFQKPDYSDLYLSLTNLRDLCKNFGITEISMPKIGCGLDRLDWTIVRKYIDKIFGNSGISVTIFIL
jgi:O-acetyl-ADP-ribose deacetylase (regulator of RNase III)